MLDLELHGARPQVFLWRLAGGRAIRTDIGERREELISGKTKPEWEAATGAYLQRLVATSRYPMRGLDRVLEGIAARLL